MSRRGCPATSTTSATLFTPVFWLKIAKNGVYCCYKYYSKLFGKMRRETEFRQVLPKLQEKVQYVRGERKLNFGNKITEILILPILPSLPMKCPKCMLGGVPEMETNCGNGIAENGRKKRKRKRKKELWQLSCRKWRGKKKMLRPQHFSQQITDG